MTHDLTKHVMDRVVHYEQRRVRRWWWGFWAVLTLLALGAVGMIISIIVEVHEDHTLSILGIVREDQVAISAAWRDIVGVVWEDLTHEKVYALVVGLVLLVGIILVTRHRRQVLARMKKDIEKLG